MTEEKFWELIEESKQTGRSAQPSILLGLLVGLPCDEIVSFFEIQRAKMSELYVFDVLAACFLICSYVSDDVFEDFTSWVVAQGRESHLAVRTDPTALCEIIAREDVDGIDWGAFAYIADEAYTQKTGKEELIERAEIAAAPDIEEDWPKTRGGLRQRYPELYDEFWDEDRTLEIHS